MNCKNYTIKVCEGNEWGLLLPLKTATYQSSKPIESDIEYENLQDIAIKVGGVEFNDFSIEQNGVLLHIPATQKVGTYAVELTATYYGIDIRAAYYECFAIVPWSYQSDAGNYLPDSPIASELAYIYVGITDDEELEALKQQYREATAACETARLQYEAAKEEFDEKAEQLDDVAKQTTLVTSAATILKAIAGIHVDIPDNIATKDDVTAAKQAILDALSHISPTDPNSLALAQFFGVTLLEGYEFMQDTEVCGELEDIMQLVDPTLTAEQAAAITEQTLNPSES